ncbi:hypothetical protein tb265_09430 [Gemmatimonadetes bacterium T265]|nr:hypothetical protein tb265_09430 [Gemmatimonadetes bacterium T265]
MPTFAARSLSVDAFPPDRPARVVPGSPAAARDARRVARWIAGGAMVAMLAAAPYRAFELDRFFVPKEIVLLLVAAGACWMTGTLLQDDGSDLGQRRGPALERLVDVALAAYLVGSVASAVLAPSGWLAARALAITGAGAGLFWAARAAAGRGAARPILGALVAAVALAAATALLQAYGVRSDYFSVNRAPGGTFGNRNFVAHLCAIGLPLAAYAALHVRRFVAALGAVLTILALGAMLVLSRSRGAWIAGAVAGVPFAIGLLRAVVLARAQGAAGAPGRWRPRPGRVALLLLALGLGTAAAVSLPNALDWRSDSPYLDSVKGVVDYKGGSGRGRLEQWRNSVRLLAADPVLGVGPGNWSVRYPVVAPAGDPSLTEDRTTANPWPSSDPVAVGSERGVLGLLALGLVAVGLLLTAHRAVWGAAAADVQAGRAPDAAARALAGGALGGVLAATLVAGAFDAVLLLAAPTIVVWPALGALSALAADGGARSAGDGRRRGLARPAVARPAVARAGAGVLALGAALAVGRAAAMPLYEEGGAAGVRLAARLAPGDYRVRLRAATLALGRGDCADARAHAEAAHTLAPTAGAPRRVLAACARRGR